MRVMVFLLFLLPLSWCLHILVYCKISFFRDTRSILLLFIICVYYQQASVQYTISGLEKKVYSIYHI